MVDKNLSVTVAGGNFHLLSHTESTLPVCALILQQSFGLLLANNDSLDLRWVHVDVELPAHQKADCGRKLGLGP